ncbi:hypothetical protein AB1K54_16630 [Microbacterium sp. BWT-B31]|uniref:hypothetical protein n=1 Tax=Microbacterium sp. BWT-B31 TaxID=3232072 RepID=UPI0035276BF3
MNRVFNVVRLQLINKQTYIWVPLLILGGAVLLTLAIYAMLVGAGIEGPFYGGGAQAPLWYFLVVGVQALTLTFPFSQAMSITRREFYLGSLLTAMLTSLILAVLFVLGAWIEWATGGWGMDGWFFNIPGISEAGLFATGLAYFTIALFAFVVGFWAATIYKRFGSLWLTVVLVGIGALLVLALFIVGRLDAWGAMFGWIAAQGSIGLSLWGLLVAALLAGTSYLTLRRTVP